MTALPAADPGRWVAVYARASKDREEKRISTARQLTEGVKLAGDQFPGMPVRTYEDDDLSGADPNVERPDYNRLIADIRLGHVVGVVTHRPSRLTRQPTQWQELVVTLTKAGIKTIHTVHNGQVAVDPGNRLVGGILNLVDAEEVERIRLLVRGAHKTIATEGRPNGGRYYGYTLIPAAVREATGEGDRRAVLVVNPKEAEVIRRIADDLIAGYSLSSIAKALNDEKVDTPRPKRRDKETKELVPRANPRWTTRTVQYVVTKPTVAGLRGYKGQLIPTERWEAILEPDRWRQVLRALGAPTVIAADGRRHKAARSHRASRRWLLTNGLARCSLCDSPLTVVQKGRGEGAAYACHSNKTTTSCGRVAVGPAEVVEELVVEAVLLALEKPEMAARLTRHPDPERAALLAELADAEATITEAVTLRGQGIYTAQQRDDQLYPAKARADRARAALAALPDPDVELPPADQIRSRWEDDQMPLRQKQALLALFLEKVELLPGKPGRSKLSTKDRVEARLRLDWRS